MSFALFSQFEAPAEARPETRQSARLGARTLSAMLVAVVLVSAVAGYAFTTGAESVRAVQAAGPELTRLLRAMALLKSLLAVGALFLVTVRFRFPIAPRLAAAYIAAGAAMAAGPGPIWTMAHVGLGALLLHGGLAAMLLLAWADGGATWRLAPWRRA